MKKLDDWAVNDYGIPSLLLMENAGGAVVNKIQHILKDVVGRHIIILAGKGNNGGDALVVARRLHELGAEVRLFLLYPPDRLSGDTLENWRLVEKQGLKWHLLGDENSFYLLKLRINQCDLVVDGIFGTGFRGKPEKSIARVIRTINDSTPPVLAIDLPSGLEADSGRVEDICIKADYTVTFAWAKRGLVVYPGKKYVGELEVANISLPGEAIRELNREEYYVDSDLVRNMLPPRDWDTHKNSLGHMLLIAGSAGMTGAAYLAAKAGLRSGAGLVTACLPRQLAGRFDAVLPEVITRGVAGEHGTISSSAWPEIEKLMPGKKAVVFGPGLGTQPDIKEILQKLFQHAGIPLVIDADGLNVLAQDRDILKQAQSQVILTPHPGEMARLLGVSTAEVMANRVEKAQEAAAAFQAIVVLKGASTVTATPQGSVYINSTGNPALATAGTGDVLAGTIGGFLAQGMSPAEAAFLGVYIHGLAGDLAAKNKGVRGVIASDVLELLPLAMQEIEKMTSP